LDTTESSSGAAPTIQPSTFASWHIFWNEKVTSWKAGTGMETVTMARPGLPVWAFSTLNLVRRTGVA
jgi:hypothetical protein